MIPKALFVVFIDIFIRYGDISYFPPCSVCFLIYRRPLRLDYHLYSLYVQVFYSMRHIQWRYKAHRNFVLDFKFPQYLPLLVFYPPIYLEIFFRCFVVIRLQFLYHILMIFIFYCCAGSK